MTASLPPLPDWPALAASGLRVQTLVTDVWVNAPCATVFALATNPSRWCRWHPATRSVEALPDRPLGLGETVREHIAAGGRRFSATWTVVAVEAPQRWVITTDTPQGLARITYRLTPEPGPNGISVTRFQRTLEFCSRSWFQRQLDPMIARWVLVPQSRRALDQLKHVVEAD